MVLYANTNGKIYVKSTGVKARNQDSIVLSRVYCNTVTSAIGGNGLQNPANSPLKIVIIDEG